MMNDTRQVYQIEINKIKADPNQPREYFDEKNIQEMANSFKTEGVLQPIEIDPNYVIIFGEIRWRAAKVAGFKTVPAMINEVDGNSRFKRQVVENIHHNTMTPRETSMSIFKLYSLIVKSAADKTIGDTINTEAVQKVAEEIGKSYGWVYQMVQLAGETNPKVIKYLGEPDASSTAIISINQARFDDKTKERLKEKVATKGIKGRDLIRKFISAIENNPDKTDQLLTEEYASNTIEENVAKINAITGRIQAPTVVNEQHSNPEKVATNMKSLALSLKELDIEKANMFEKMQIKKMLDILIPELTGLAIILSQDVTLRQQLDVEKKKLKSGK